MWESLKTGLRKCQSKIRLKTYFLLFFLVVSLQCYSLSESEIDALPTLSNQALINIILIYDKAMTEDEQDLIPLIMNLQKALLEVQALQTELNLQENLSVMLLNQHKQEIKVVYERGFKAGFTFGVFGGGIIGGGISYTIGQIK